MPLELTPLDETALPPAVLRSVSASAAPQLRMMAARAMAPLAPSDLVVALYQLAHCEDDALVEVARQTAGELPDPLLSVALAAPLDPRVLDFFARSLLTRPKPMALVLANPATADETFAQLAARGSDALLEQIAHNQQRLLRHPAIITALYLNPRTRMSTAMRALELAVRAGVAVEGIPCYEDVKGAIEQENAAHEQQAQVPAEVVDAAFTAALALGGDVASQVAATGDPGSEEAVEAVEAAIEAVVAAAEEQAEAPAPETIHNIAQLPMAAKLRLAAVGGAFARSHLVRDSNKVVALSAVRSPALTDQEAERYAGNRALYEEVIRHLASQRQFTKRYPVKMNLVNNPKCPLSLAIGFLGHLTARDLKTIARSKSVPSALTKAAQNLLNKRENR